MKYKNNYLKFSVCEVVGTVELYRSHDYKKILLLNEKNY